MANPPDNDQNKKPDQKERNLAAPATTKPVEKHQPAVSNTSKPTVGQPNIDSERPLSTANLADKATATKEGAGEKLTNTAGQIKGAGATALSGAAAAASKGITAAESTVTDATAGVRSAASNTASKLRDSANTAGQSDNLTSKATSRPVSSSDRKPAPPAATPAANTTQRPAGIDRASTAPPTTTSPAQRAERPTTARPVGSDRPVSRPGSTGARADRPASPTHKQEPTRLARSPLERPPGLDRPQAMERPGGLERPTRSPLERPRGPATSERVSPADRRPVTDTRATTRPPEPRRSDRPANDRPRGERPRRPRPDERPRPENRPSHFRDNPRGGRRMAPPPGASKNGRFVGRPPQRVAAPINPAYSEEGGAWGPLLFGLLLLLGVGWYAIKHYTPQIQDDLLRRSDSALDTLGLAGQTELAIDGRNIVMTGNVATEADRGAAEEAVAATFGVRAVDNQLVVGDVSATPSVDVTNRERPSLNLKQAGESVTLTGTVSDEKFATALQTAANAHYGEDNVNSEIAIDKSVTNPGWLSAVTQLMPEMNNVEQPGLAIADGTLTLTGLTDNADSKQALGDKADELLKGHLVVDNQIEAPEPEPAPEPAPEPEPETATAPEPAPEPAPAPAPRVLPAFASVTQSDDQITLSGFMSAESADVIAAAYGDSGKTVVNNISVNELAETPEWVSHFNEALTKLDNVQNGKLTVARSGNLTLNGVVDSDAAKQAVGDEISALFGDDHKVINDIAVELPPVVPTMTPFASVIDNEDKISLSGLLPESAAKALLKSYRSGDKAVVDNIAIDERVMTPAWTDQLAESLDSIIYIENPRINVTSGGELIVRGTAQSDEASTAASETLSELFGDSVTLRNDITVKTPTITEPPKPDIRELLGQINVAGIRFRSNSAELNGESVAILEQVADVLSQYQDTAFEISGHTDSAGSQEYNLALSADRATTVMQFLETRGIASDRMSAKGYGPARPIATNDNAAGRAQNRRIEFTLTGE